MGESQRTPSPGTFPQVVKFDILILFLNIPGVKKDHAVDTGLFHQRKSNSALNCTNLLPPISAAVFIPRTQVIALKSPQRIDAQTI